MTGDGFGWVACSSSLERRRWLRFAAVGCIAVAVALLFAVVADPTPLRVGGLALAVGGAVLALRQAQAADPAGELRLDAAGVFWWRPVGQDQPERLAATGLSRWLVMFDGAGSRRCIWRDSLPATHWRLLRAHVRWHVERDRAGSRGARVPAQRPDQ
jgi:hypothetical protein